jgi:hypothetical protein
MGRLNARTLHCTMFSKIVWTFPKSAGNVNELFNIYPQFCICQRVCLNSVQINGEDVSAASHEHVVDLIRCSGDLVSMTVVSVGATAPGGVPCSKSSTLLPGSGGPSHHRQYATLPRKMNTSNTGTIGKFHLSAELATHRFPVHLLMSHIVQSIVQQSLRRHCFVSQFVVFHLYPVFPVNSEFFIFIWFCQAVHSFTFEFGFSSQSMVFHLYLVLAVSVYISMCIQFYQSVHSFPFAFNFPSQCAVLPTTVYTVISAV